jgi:hypothetical protein
MAKTIPNNVNAIAVFSFESDKFLPKLQVFYLVCWGKVGEIHLFVTLKGVIPMPGSPSHVGHEGPENTPIPESLHDDHAVADGQVRSPATTKQLNPEPVPKRPIDPGIKHNEALPVRYLGISHGEKK